MENEEGFCPWGGANEMFVCQDRNVAPQTGVAKPYPCHTTFQTGVAAATPATPLPAPLTVTTTFWKKVVVTNVDTGHFLKQSFAAA